MCGALLVVVASATSETPLLPDTNPMTLMGPAVQRPRKLILLLVEPGKDMRYVQMAPQ